MRLKFRFSNVDLCRRIVANCAVYWTCLCRFSRYTKGFQMVNMYEYCIHYQLLTRLEHLSSPPVLWCYPCWSSFYFLCLLCVFALCVRCCDVRCDFQIIMIFGSSLPPVVCRFVLFMLFVFVCPTHIMLCFCCFTSSRVPNVASFSGLSISDCPFGII